MAGLHQPLLLLLLIFSLAQTDSRQQKSREPSCSIRPPNESWGNPLRSQIVGGHEVKPHSRPYLAYLRGRSFFCAGFLVAPQWVMTTAHCRDIYRVILGAHNISIKENSQQVFSVVANYPHPKYDDKTLSNDIRLLKLNSPAILNEYVNILPLPKSRRDLSDGTPCSVAGWSRVYKGLLTDTLYETDTTIYDRRQCQKLYRYLHNGKICAGRHCEPESVFKEVSGAPLVCDGVAQGIVSYGYDCPPGVYARVAYYIPWIRKTMKL